MEGHPESADLASALDGAVSAWLARDGRTTSIEMAQGVAEPAATARVSEVVSLSSPGSDPDVKSTSGSKSRSSLEHPVDLSSNRAGALVREQALALKQAAPVRAFLQRALGVHSDERSWRIGAVGEEKVAAQLEKLLRKDPRWRILHAVRVGERGSDIDHVVIGPGGVFTINAKHHPGAKIWVGGDTFMVNGQRQPYIRNSRHEAKRAARLLSATCGFPVEVARIVVPVRADDVAVKQAPDGVFVVPRARVARWLRKRPKSCEQMLSRRSLPAPATRRPGSQNRSGWVRAHLVQFKVGITVARNPVRSVERGAGLGSTNPGIALQ